MTLTKTFVIDVVSKIDGERYYGNFTTKKLTVMDHSRLGALKAQYASGHTRDITTNVGVDAGTDIINEMVAHCTIALVQKPDWFKTEELVDLEVLHAVYREVSAWEISFHSGSRTESEGSSNRSKDNGTEEFEGQRRTSRDVAALVESKVPKIIQVE